MPKKYCPKCGAGTDYSFDEPNFCSSCASNFNVEAVANTFKKPLKKKQRQIEEDEDEETEEEMSDLDFHSIKKLKVTIEDIPALNKMPMPSAFGQVGGVAVASQGENLSAQEKHARAQQLINSMRTTERRSIGQE